MSKKRRQHSAQYKFQVALEATKGEKTVSQIGSIHNVHPNQVSQWKRQLLENGADVFSQNGANKHQDQEAIQTELYEQIGRLKMELEWVKKKSLLFS